MDDSTNAIGSLEHPPVLEASWAMPATDFPQEAWATMHRYIFAGFGPAKLEREILAIARSWLPYPVSKSGGLWMAHALYGQYIWHYAVVLEQNRRWGFPEFAAARAFGRSGQRHLPGGKGEYRGANPYPKMSYERYMAWDTGYILGGSERKAAAVGGWQNMRD